MSAIPSVYYGQPTAVAFVANLLRLVRPVRFSAALPQERNLDLAEPVATALAELGIDWPADPTLAAGTLLAEGATAGTRWPRGAVAVRVAGNPTIGVLLGAGIYLEGRGRRIGVAVGSAFEWDAILLLPDLDYGGWA